MDKKHYQLLIMGSGPAGCTAAIYAARANLNFAIITGAEEGGQLINSPAIANWPAEIKIAGSALMEKILNQIRNFNAIIHSDRITKVNLSNHPFELFGETAEYTCDALIIATGASPKFLGLPEEKKYLGQGVSTCALCDGFFYKNKNVAIVGGGNVMAEEALYLANLAKTVTIIHRRNNLKAEEQLIEQLKNTPNIQWEINCVITEILGNEQGVNSLTLKNVSSNTNKNIATDALFIAIGHTPNTEMFVNQLELDHGYIKTGNGALSATSIPGVFAAGDVIANNYQQAIVAAGSGCIASLDAKNYLLSKG